MKPLYTLGLLILGYSSIAQTPTIISNHVISGTCTAMAYGNGIYVASSSGTFTSTNARIWTLLNDSVPSFSFLTFADGVFVGVAGTAIYSSTNGTNWTSRFDMGDFANELIFTHGSFYAVCGTAGVFTSADGLNWAGLNLGIDIPTPIAYGGFDYNGSAYAIGITLLATRYFPQASSGVLYSPNAVPGSWAFYAVSAAPPVSGLRWVKDRFYLFARDGIYNSTDGINWALPSPPMVDTMDGSIGAASGSAVFTVGDSIYLIGGSSMEISTDGTHFKSYNPPGVSSIGGLSANGLTFIYGGGGLATASDGIHFTLNGTFFSAVASNGSNFVAAGWDGAAGALFSSPDFVNWTQQPPVAASMTLYNGSKYVAEGAGNAWFSTDGTAWTGTPVGIDFTAMDYGAGRYVAGTFYDLLSSADGINWSEVDSSDTYYYKIRYVNNTFFALGMDFQAIKGKILQSADGVHWTNITPQLDSAVIYYNDAMYDGTKYYFTGLKNWTDFFTISTTDPTNTTSYGAMGGILDTATGTPLANYFPQFDDFLYHNGRFVGTVTNSAGSVLYLAYSTDGMNWSISPLGGSAHAKTIVSASDVYHIVSEDGGYYTVTFGAAAPPPALLRFDADAVPSLDGGQNSRLTWETKNDSVIAYYLVQHGLDTIHWDSIGRVNAERKRDRRERKWDTEKYQFMDDGPPAGPNYYRLGLTDRTGHRWWSPVRRVDIRKDISIYPNPASDVLHVQLPEPGRARLTIFDRGWQPVRRLDASGSSVTIDLRSLHPGVYYLLVIEDGKRYSKEFIIQ